MSPYVGRFAPSPTGPLHFGSLVTALASYLDAKANNGKWLVRIEDLDTARVQPGAADQILRDLELFGLAWDGPVVYQSERLALYEEAFRRLDTYPCACSRKEVAGRYPGTCANGLRPGQSARAWRVRAPSSLEAGDFIVRRADGPFAYQLAVVVDDAAQCITHVVRGADLLDNTPRQVFLQQALGYPTPVYTHVPLALDANGTKLSKSTGAASLDRSNPQAELARAKKFLAS